jgi:NADH dehydrogenase/NADH:ubiquinone oxidoreductase subunit G
MRIFAAFFLLIAFPLGAATIDRIAAIVDRQVLTVSEISQMVEIHFFPRTTSWSEDEYRKNILDSLIAQALRFRDVERFGAEDVSKDSIEARLLQIQQRFASQAEFTAALQRAELTLDEVRALIKRQAQVETYIQERFAPMIFVSTDEIENYYKTTWSQQRTARGLPIPPLAEVQDDIRTLLKSARLQQEVERWTTQLRARANVDIYTWR